ncbi:hypothetical protein BGZ49_010632 [Haplosporangium sp. Z 27]|nr:hypothetical protein BGZ49_010632 [Haplosporangium sp. Z 27]
MAASVKTGDNSRHRMMFVILALLLVLAIVVSPCTATPTDPASSTVSTPSAVITPTVNVTTPIIIPTNTSTIATITTAVSSIPATTSVNLTSSIPVATTNATSTPTESPKDSDDNQGLIIGGAAVGGLVFAIGIGLIAFRCTLNRRERQRRNKEMAATLAESFDRDTIASPRKGYLELADGPSTPRLGSNSNLTRQGSQDAYFAAHKEGGVVGQSDYYNHNYVQERYGTANAGNYGMYEETELSVIGGSNGRSATPYVPNVDHSMQYPPSGMTNNHYAGYNDYNGHQGYYGGGQGY